jgi:hypothetical protein
LGLPRGFVEARLKTQLSSVSYDNGNFDVLFLSFEHLGGNAILLSDINDDGQMVGQRWNGGPTWNGLFLVDDGIVFDVKGLPSDWILQQVRGINNEGQFVGVYLQQAGIDPFGGPRYEAHGFISHAEGESPSAR